MGRFTLIDPATLVEVTAIEKAMIQIIESDALTTDDHDQSSRLLCVIEVVMKRAARNMEKRAFTAVGVNRLAPPVAYMKAL